MRKSYILLFAIMLCGRCFGQYLTYQELVGLLKVAHDEVKVDDYLVKIGFEFCGNNNDAVGKGYSYCKVIEGLIYIVGVNYYRESDALVVSELSQSANRWKYYKEIAQSNGFKQIESSADDESVLTIKYQNKDYQLTMQRGTYDNKILFKIKLKRIKQ